MNDCAYCGNARELERMDPDGRMAIVACPACRLAPGLPIDQDLALRAAIAAVEQEYRRLRIL